MKLATVIRKYTARSSTLIPLETNFSLTGGIWGKFGFGSLDLLWTEQGRAVFL
jgi:hypothetical protein